MRQRSRKDDTSVLATIDGNTSFGSKRRNKNRRRSGGRRSSLSIESCGDEMLDEVTSLLDGENNTTNGRRIVFEDDDDDDGEENYLEPLQNVKRNNNDDDISKKKKKKSSLNGSKIRKRRRSSAVFLHLSDRFGGSEDDPNNRNGGNQEQLGEMYRQAIKMNAENKLNATNSWGFNFIENMHKFLGDEEVDTTTDNTSMKTIKEETKTSSSGTTKRVNFTKASCTLDASVKIYSYRVDDVHLSSYKVLANLNRTDNGKKNKDNNNTNNDGETNIDNKHKSSSRSMQSKSGCTLERNMGKYTQTYIQINQQTMTNN